MHRLVRTAVAASLAAGVALATVTPGVAAALPGPRKEQWWFTAWAVQDKVWPITQGQGVTVAVIDSGVEADLPDLAGVVLPGVDLENGGDGRTDIDSADPPGHGTGMAALIASQGRGTGFLGVAPRTKILPIASKTMDHMVVGIHYAISHGAKVINISEGGPASCPSELQQAIADALQHDVIVVAAAGNEGQLGNPSVAPANCAGVLAVGGLDSRLRPFVKTQRQPYVTVSAPATGVGSVLKDGRFHTSEGGTSSATALTSAAVALVRSKFPGLSAREVLRRIMASLRDAGPPGRDDATGYGAVRPYQALTIDPVPANIPNPVFAAYDKWAAAHGKQNSGSAAAKRRGVGSSSGGGGSALVLGIGAAVVVLVVLVLVVILVSSRSRRRRAAALGPMPDPPGFPVRPAPPHPYGRPQGPPPGFGPGPPGPPPHQQGIPPVPPQGPPRGGGRQGYWPPYQDPPAPYGQQDPPPPGG